jgi:hypothetical protein
MLTVALVIYAVVALYLLFFVGLPILFSADCDHAFLLLLPPCVGLPLVWPLALVYFGAQHIRATLTKGSGS